MRDRKRNPRRQAFRSELLAFPIVLGALLFGVLGCVSKGTYRDMMEERNRFAETNAKLQEEIQALESSKDDLSAKLTVRDEKLSDLRGTYDGLVSDLQSELASGQVQIERLRNGIRVNLAEEILFPSGSAKLDDRGRDVLAKVVAQVVEAPHRVEVRGHTDDLPISGSLAQLYPTNWELGGARAARVVRLFEDEGIAGARMRAVSKSKFDPLAPNDSPESRERNRRIEIRLLPAAGDGATASAAAAPAPS